MPDAKGCSAKTERLTTKESMKITATILSTGRLFLGVFLFSMLAMGQFSSAEGYIDLYDFPGSSGACCPQHPSIVAQGQDGNLYGITSFGGSILRQARRPSSTTSPATPRKTEAFRYRR